MLQDNPNGNGERTQYTFSICGCLSVFVPCDVGQ